MALKLYNTLTRKKETFRSREGKKVNLFVCGITSYDLSHIGHARTYLFFDMIAKYLREKGYDVFYLQNITDIDDKILARAKREKISWQELSKKFEREYLKDMKTLNVNSVTKYARATAHVKEIISQVKRLLEKGFAYRIKDGIYYDIKKFRDYGKLSRRTVLQAEDAISRIDEAKGKKNKGDFCLWKYAKSLSSPSARSIRKGTSESEPAWSSPWGLGRPGWHIEDTAICEKYFGPQYDIHGGARDLIFPHHEAEIAQMEAISSKKPMVKYWLHAGFLTVRGQKMAKSLRNFITIQDFLKNHSPRLLRFFILKSHYSSPIDYSEKKILQVKKQLERIDEFLDKLNRIKGFDRKFKTVDVKHRQLIKRAEKELEKAIEKAMDDDFNTPMALAAVFRFINRVNQLFDKGKLTPFDTRDIVKFLRKIDKVFNFIFWGRLEKKRIPANIFQLVKEREKFRQKGNYKKADEIRRKVKDIGYWIEDTKEGPKIKKL